MQIVLKRHPIKIHFLLHKEFIWFPKASNYLITSYSFLIFTGRTCNAILTLLHIVLES